MSEYNKKAKSGLLFASAKVRVVLLIVGILVIGAVVMMAWKYYNRVQGYQGAATVTAPPNIESLPGAGNPTEHYVKTQNIENATSNQNARKDATSAIPTITRSSFVGSTSAFENESPDGGANPSSAGLTGGQASQDILPIASSFANNTCPASQVVYMYRPNPANCSVPNLKLARQAGVTAQELRCQACSCPALRVAGFTAGELKGIGYSAADLKTCGFDLEQLIAAGFSAAELKKAGFSPEALRRAGALIAGDEVNCDVNAIKQARAAGATATQFKNCGAAALIAAGFTPAELSKAGFSAAQIAAANQSSENCSVEALKKARMQGVSAVALKAKGCGAAALKAAGFTAAELKNAGFSAAELKAAGFSAEDLKNAGFSAKELRDAGFSAAELKKAGFDAAALKAAGFSAGELKAAGFSAAELKKAGFSAAALHDAGFSAAELKAAGFSASELKKAGYTPGDLLRAGYTAAASGFTEPRATGDTAADAIAGGDAAAAGTLSSSSGSAQNANSMPAMGMSNQEERLSALANAQQKLMNQQQRQDAIQQTQGQMIVMAQKLMAGWSVSTSQSAQEAVPIATASASAAGGGTIGAAGKGDAANTGPVIKAGTIMFGVLDSSVNSDENTPVIATVVSGKLKGSKLMGSFTRVDKRLLIKFTLVNVPYFEHTFTGNIVAIDSNTARTALSGYVDNHYMLRYGSLFASTFLAGVSDGIIKSGSTVGSWPDQETTYSEFTPAEYLALGLGNMGKEYSHTMSGNFKVPPTVQVPGGTAVGLLFMEDVVLPRDIPQRRIGGVEVIDDTDNNAITGGQ